MTCDHKNTVNFTMQGIDWCGECGAMRCVGWNNGKWTNHNRSASAPTLAALLARLVAIDKHHYDCTFGKAGEEEREHCCCGLEESRAVLRGLGL